MNTCVKKIRKTLSAPILYKLSVDLFALMLIGAFLFLIGTILFPTILTMYFPVAFVFLTMIAFFLFIVFIGKIQHRRLKKSFSKGLWIFVFVCATPLMVISLLSMTGWILLSTLLFSLVLYYLLLTQFLHN